MANSHNVSDLPTLAEHAAHNDIVAGDLCAENDENDVEEANEDEAFSRNVERRERSKTEVMENL